MSTIEKALSKKRHQESLNEQAPVNSQYESLEPSQREKKFSVNTPKLDVSLSVLKENGMVGPTADRRKINDEYRAIKRKLLNNAFGSLATTHRHSNLIAVTSSKPNEGKTFNAINLALSISIEQDRTVLLVDADVINPSVCKDLGIDANEHKGLTEYLLGEFDDISEAIYETNIPKLRVIPAGKPHHLSSELLSSSRMTSLLKELSSRYDDRVILFDSPPLLGVNEAIILTNLMGQAVIVAEEDSSKITELQEAVSLLDENLAVGVVLNKCKHSINNLYGYGYGYGVKE